MIREVRTMNAREFLNTILSRHQKNELLFASRIYEEEFSDQISEQAYYKGLERMTRAGSLCKVSKGVYYIPEISKFGVVPLSEKRIVSTFVAGSAGMEIGYGLYRKMNLTTQVSKNIELYSNRISGQSKRIGNVFIKKAALDFSPEMETIVAGLEVMQHYAHIQDLNEEAFLQLAKAFAHSFDQQLFDTAISEIRYKKSTLAFAENILDFYGVENTIGQRLSRLSTYRFPRMEALYETACL